MGDSTEATHLCCSLTSQTLPHHVTFTWGGETIPLVDSKAQPHTLLVTAGDDSTSLRLLLTRFCHKG